MEVAAATSEESREYSPANCRDHPLDSSLRSEFLV